MIAMAKITEIKKSVYRRQKQHHGAGDIKMFLLKKLLQFRKKKKQRCIRTFNVTFKLIIICLYFFISHLFTTTPS